MHRVFEVFLQTKVAHFCFCLVHIVTPLFKYPDSYLGKGERAESGAFGDFLCAAQGGLTHMLLNSVDFDGWGWGGQPTSVT